MFFSSPPPNVQISLRATHTAPICYTCILHSLLPESVLLLKARFLYILVDVSEFTKINAANKSALMTGLRNSFCISFSILSRRCVLDQSVCKVSAKVIYVQVIWYHWILIFICSNAGKKVK